MDITTLTTRTQDMITKLASVIVAAVVAFVNFILPYSIAIALLLVGLAIVWRVYRSVAHV